MEGPPRDSRSVNGAGGSTLECGPFRPLGALAKGCANSRTARTDRFPADGSAAFRKDDLYPALLFRGHYVVLSFWIRTRERVRSAILSSELAEPSASNKRAIFREKGSIRPNFQRFPPTIAVIESTTTLMSCACCRKVWAADELSSAAAANSWVFVRIS